jgi:hypothetical protein
MPLGMDGGAIGRVEVHRRRRIGAAKRLVVTHIDPKPAGPGLHLGEHWNSGVVAMDASASEHVRLDQLVERHQHRRAGTDMIRHGRERKLDPLAVILLALPIERLMIGVLRNQNHCQQARPGIAARDRMERRRRLRDRLARPAGELLAHVLGHEPSPWHHIERLGDVLADLRELATATART